MIININKGMCLNFINNRNVDRYQRIIDSGWVITLNLWRWISNMPLYDAAEKLGWKNDWWQLKLFQRKSLTIPFDIKLKCSFGNNSLKIEFLWCVSDKWLVMCDPLSTSIDKIINSTQEFVSRSHFSYSYFENFSR